MKRADIVNKIARNEKITLDKKDIATIVNETFDLISDYLTNDIHEGKK